MGQYYWDYLRLDKLLDAQRPISAERGEPAHDEMLFIVVHQAFELWFKQILTELDRVLEITGGPVLEDRSMSKVVAALSRITAIQRVLNDQLEVLETMTPLDFLDFRDRLVPASGFQSVQFRLIENRLGLDPQHRLKIKGSPYTAVLSDDHVRLLEEAGTQPSLFDQVERWLARTPFLSFGGFDFWRAYAEAAERAQLEGTAEGFGVLLDPQRYEDERRQHRRRLSRPAILAALLISLYRDEPVFQLPFRFLTGLVDVDEGFTAWRYRHALLAQRMIGARFGTGGTPGHTYLEAAARKHRVFADLVDLPTFFLPRSALPALPAHVERQMGFRYHMEEKESR